MNLDEDPVTVTRCSYEKGAGAYSRRTASYDSFPGLRAEVESFSADVCPPGPILEVGFGGGRDIRLFQASGHRVVGVEIAPAFAYQLKGTCDDVAIADIRHLPFKHESFVGVWAAAVIHHLVEADYAIALAELYRVTAPDGNLGVSVKAGESASYVQDATGRRWFTLVSPARLRAFISDAGFSIDNISTRRVGETTWLSVRARRRRLT